MTSERIKEIQKGTAYPESTSVMLALKQVWNECLQKQRYTEEDMLTAAKYGYDFHKTTQFPEQDFKESCIRNTQQWLTTIKNKK